MRRPWLPGALAALLAFPAGAALAGAPGGGEAKGRPVVAIASPLVAHYDGDDAIVTHVAAGRPATVHVTLLQRRDANKIPGPAAPGAPMAAFWTVPRIAGPANARFHILGGTETYPLRPWK